MSKKELEVIEAMRTYGGSFAKSLGATMILADLENFRRLRTAFPEIWGDYEMMVDRLNQQTVSERRAVA